MNELKKYYKSIVFGAILLFIGMTLLSYLGYIRIPDDAPVETGIIFCIWWVIISIIFQNISQLKNKKTFFAKIGLLCVVLFIIFGTNEYFDVPDHPLVIFLVVLFWLGLFYLFFPTFFTKYFKVILPIYGLALLYFFYVRMDANYNEFYQERAMTLLMIPIPFLLSIWVYEQWKWIKDIQSEKSKAELELLKNQVNPHFFFNTLNNLYTLTIKQSEKAPDMILKLSDMMRYTIYEGENEFVPLIDEIEYLKNYIALQKIRYHKNVAIKFEYDCVEGERIAPLLFIILLENAFKHGVEKMTNDAYVHIDLNSNKEEIVFTVENNIEDQNLLDPQKKGIGLDNLRRRLELMYPGHYELNIHQKSNLYSVELVIYKT